MKFKALRTPKESAMFEHNHFGWQTIEVLVFNYDGKGGAIVLNDDELDTCTEQDLRDIIYGGWYAFDHTSIYALRFN